MLTGSSLLRSLLGVFASALVAFAVIGCSGTSTSSLTPASTPLPTTATSTETPASGFIAVRVKWPTPSGSTRLIPLAAKTIEITVTGQNIDPAVTATITYPTVTGTISVPAGLNRQVSAVVKDMSGLPITGGKSADTLRVLPEHTTNVTVPLTGINEPENNYSESAQAINLPETGATTVYDVLDGTAPSPYDDTLDYYALQVEGGQFYTVQLLAPEGAISPKEETSVTLEALDTIDVTLDSRSSIYDTELHTLTMPEAFGFTAPSSGTVYLKVYGSGTTKLWYGLKVTKNGSGDLSLTLE